MFVKEHPVFYFDCLALTIKFGFFVGGARYDNYLVLILFNPNKKRVKHITSCVTDDFFLEGATRQASVLFYSPYLHYILMDRR